MFVQLIIIVLFSILFCVIMGKISIGFLSENQPGILRHDKSIHYLGWFCFEMAMLPVIFYFVAPSKDIWVGLSLISPFGLWAFFYCISAKYVYSDTYFEHNSWVTPSDVYSWRSLLYVQYDDGTSHTTKPRTKGFIMVFPHKDIVIPTGTDNESHFLEFLDKKGIKIQDLDSYT